MPQGPAGRDRESAVSTLDSMASDRQFGLSQAAKAVAGHQIRFGSGAGATEVTAGRPVPGAAGAEAAATPPPFRALPDCERL